MNEQVIARFRRLLSAKCSSISNLDQQLAMLNGNAELCDYLVRKAMGERVEMDEDVEQYLAQVLLMIVDTERLNRLVDLARDIKNGDVSRIPEFRKIARSEP